jgi:iron complex transport system ATP-binding protein
METTSYLSTSGLCIGYTRGKKENRLFENLNLTLPAGRLVCFMGPNGIGKSSLIRTLSGLQKAVSGEVHIVHGATTADRAKQIAVVLTDKIAASHMSAYEVIAFGRYPYTGWSINLTREDQAVIEQSIAMVHIQALADRKLQELSDGQLQMVMIARALAQDTPVVLLDEPTAHLDLNNRVEIMKLLRTLSRTTNKSILVATHELDLALQMADVIWLTGKNKNIITGIPEDLVLNGSFDTIFEFKGFDLKTGKVQHEVDRETSVQLTGDGSTYLWTRNALERNGFYVTDSESAVQVSIEEGSGRIRWILRKGGNENNFESIGALLNSI